MGYIFYFFFRAKKGFKPLYSINVDYIKEVNYDKYHTLVNKKFPANTVIWTIK